MADIDPDQLAAAMKDADLWADEQAERVGRNYATPLD
jgi:hypothetical protein